MISAALLLLSACSPTAGVPDATLAEQAASTRASKAEVCHWSNGDGEYVLLHVSTTSAHFDEDKHPHDIVTGGDVFYADADGDGYGDADATPTDCPDSLTGWSTNDGDCDDDDDDVSPDAEEVCDDSVDNDCDGEVDEDCAECGDLVVEGDEECDEGSYSATCDSDCTLPECGDEVVNVFAGETCDPPVDPSCTEDCGFYPPVLMDLDLSCDDALETCETSSGYVVDCTQCTLLGSYSSGPPVDLTWDPTITWGSQDANVGQVDSSGLVYFIATGEVEINAVYETSHLAASASLTAPDDLSSPTALDFLDLDPASDSLDIGEYGLLAAYYTDWFGTYYPGGGGVIIDITSSADVAWGTADALVAQVDSAGQVVGIGPGTTTIHAAESNTHTAASAEITVTEP